MIEVEGSGDEDEDSEDGDFDAEAAQQQEHPGVSSIVLNPRLRRERRLQKLREQKRLEQHRAAAAPPPEESEVDIREHFEPSLLDETGTTFNEDDNDEPDKPFAVSESADADDQPESGGPSSSDA